MVGQIHDDQDDVIVFRLAGSKLFVDINGEDGPVLDPDYALGERFTVAFEVRDDRVDCYFNDVLAYTHEQAFTGAYFKAGAHVQSSCQATSRSGARSRSSPSRSPMGEKSGPANT